MTPGSDLFFSNISRVDRNLIGFAIGAGLENRNAFGGSEKYKLTLEAGIEFDAQTQEVNTLTLGINNAIDIPMFTKPLNTLLLANKLKLIKDKSIRKIQDEASTQINFGF